MNTTLEEEDELVEEIDVFFNGDLLNELFVFQYPLRSSEKPESEYAELTNVMYNKESCNLKLVYSIESKQKNFDTQYYDQKTFLQNMLGQKIEPNTNYCLGVYRNNSLYLNPISDFLQFRNDFSHMEAIESSSKKKMKEKIVSRKESIGGTQVTDPSKDNKEIQSTNENNWVDLKFYKKETIQSYQISDRLFIEENIKPEKLEFLPEKDYYSLLFSNVNREFLIERTSDKSLSYKDLMELPLPNKVEYFMKKLSVVNYYVLKKYCLAEGIKDNIFIEVCLRCARILKNGNLILKSEFKYDPTLKSDICTKRNYVINLLQNNPLGINRNEIKFLDKNEIDEILNEIADKKGGSYFIKQNSNDGVLFIQNFKAIYDVDYAYWDGIQLKHMYHSSSSVALLNEQIGNTNNIQSTSNKISTVNGTKFNIDFIKSLILKSFNKSDCILLNDLLNCINKEFNININEDDNKDLINTINDLIKNICYTIDGVCYLKDVGDAEVKNLRKALIEYLAVKKSCKKPEIKTHLQSLSLSVTDNILNKVLKTVGNCSSNFWTLKTPNQ